MPRRSIAIVVLAAALAACSDEPKPRRQTRPNAPTVGIIDKPAPNEVVPSMIVVAGWAVDESEVERVRIYVEDQLAATVTLTVSRPDVEKVYPAFAREGAKHGWQAQVDLGDRIGPCTIRAEALDGRGALTRFADVTVRVAP